MRHVLVLQALYWMMQVVVVVHGLSLSSWSTLKVKTVKKEEDAPMVCYENDPQHLELLLQQQTSTTKKKPMIMFYRDVNGVCPYSERVWLALEHKNVMKNVVTVLTEDLENVPRMEWPDGTMQCDSMDILEHIETYFGGSDDYDLYPKVSGSVDGVRANVVRFNGVPPTYSGVFPRHVDLKNKYAPFLYRRRKNTQDDDMNNNDFYEPVALSNHMVTLEEADEMLEEYEDGPFFCGNVVTAADYVWLPFMERYAIQLPLITFPNVRNKDFVLNPRSESSYPAVHEWMNAIGESVPSYLCRICGDARMWSQCLQKGIDYQQQKASKNNDVDFVPLSTTTTTSNNNVLWRSPRGMNVLDLWKEYAMTRPYVADTPVQECVSFIIQNKDQLSDIIQRDNHNKIMETDDVDNAMREICDFLLTHDDDDNILPYWGGSTTAISIEDAISKLSGNARDALASIDDYISVPRDMGLIPATVIRSLAKAAPRPRIQ